VATLECQGRARLLGRRYFMIKFFDDVTNFCDLLSVAGGELTASDVKAVFDAYAHMAPQ
jgi:hypothetical protein